MLIMLPTSGQAESFSVPETQVAHTMQAENTDCMMHQSGNDMVHAAHAEQAVASPAADCCQNDAEHNDCKHNDCKSNDCKNNDGNSNDCRQLQIQQLQHISKYNTNYL